MIERNQIFLDGKWTESSGTEVLAVINPTTEEQLATIPAGTPEDVDRAARAAAAAFPTWSQTSTQERALLLKKLADALEARAEEITRTIVSEVGQPAKQAATAQTSTAIADLRIAAESLDEIAWDERVGNTIVHRAPAGVVGAITPWNAPLKMVCMKAGAALAAGCTVVLKGTEVAPLSAFIFAEAVAEVGLPEGVFNLVSGTGPIVGEAIATHPLIDMVSLTGSVRAGRRVMQLAAGSIKRVSLELGGKSANIILPDADLETAISDGMEDSFRNSGQVCGGLSRVLVPRARLTEAEEIARAKADSYILGDPFDPKTTLGPVTTAAQRDRIRTYIRSGLDEGMRMMTGGPEAPDGLSRGYFVRPTVFSGNNQNRIAREEIFGPVVVLIPFDGDDEAIEIANDSDYGLAAAIWSGDAERAKRVARRVRAGRIRINGSPINPRAPHGGFKLSGIGREFGRFGVEEFTEYQAIG
ncbi:aldehyde dehydrogenase family protein [Arthrobacter sp. FW306-04-A]|uniref:aldehyde dehydrogenase family protein n=1 Tax=Arthrobacter sp. FW306-04-A TaxID=2879619 RepID=UPI0037C07C7D|nr:aldehyde dehydrogenase family protein [Arthrobacter sp. FW306-04-A]